MRYFTPQWYHGGCRRVPEYEARFAAIADRLPPFFREGPSLHDAQIVRWSVAEPHWGRQDLTIGLNTHGAYAKVKQLIFLNCETDTAPDPIGCRWIADELSVEEGRFTLNVLLMTPDSELSEISLRFAALETNP